MFIWYIIILHFQIKSKTQMDAPQQHVHSGNNITITYTDKLTKITKTPQKSTKILSIMSRLSTDGGVWISNGAWKELGFYDIFQQQVQESDDKDKVIITWGVRTTLGLISNFESQLPKQLSSTGFPHLLFLCLDHNNIQSVQPLKYANMPTLTILHLNDNKIINLKPITRAYFPQLRALGASNNLISDYFMGACLSQGNWPQLTHISFQKSSAYCFMLPRFAGLGNLCKLETRNLVSFGTLYNQDEQNKLKQMLAQLQKKYDKFSFNQSVFICRTIIQQKIAQRAQRESQIQQAQKSKELIKMFNKIK